MNTENYEYIKIAADLDTKVGWRSKFFMSMDKIKWAAINRFVAKQIIVATNCNDME